MSRLFLIVWVAASAAGCHVDLNDPGTEPPSNQLYFPSGIVADPAQPFLYVSNGDADLRYGGGTVQMIDLQRYTCAQETFLGTTPAGCDAALAQADAAGCRYDWLDPRVVDCDASIFIIGDSTVKVGTFAGNMVLQADGDRRRLFVGVRGDPSITEIDAFPVATQYGRRLNCFDTPNFPPNGVNPAGCTQSHRIQDYNCHDQPNCVQNADPNLMGSQLIPTEPFGLRFDTGTKADGSIYQRLLVAHLETGQVSIINIGDNGSQLAYISNPFFMEDAQHRHGAFSLAPQLPGQGANTLWYMTSSLSPTIATFKVADVDVLVPSVTMDVRNFFPGGGDVRAVAFQPDGQRLFLSENNPPSVIVVDTRPQAGPNMPLSNANQVIDIVNVCQSPSHMQPYTINWQGPPGTPPRTKTKLYVVCFQSNQIMVVDPDRPGVDDTILVGRGPNDIVFTQDRVTGTHRAYVTNFSENSIGVIDIEPGSPTENRMIARIGIPVPPMNF